MNEGSLKLIAKDSEDLEILAVLLQDAIVPVCDMMFREGEKNFVMIVHRFRWDESGSRKCIEKGCFERVCCAVDICGVTAVQRRKIAQGDEKQMLDLLTLTLEGDTLTFLFAGDAALKLELADWRVRLNDFGDPWPVAVCPAHA
jgi:hypothetical protein